MKSAHVIYHLARADFLERLRRYSFLVMLGLVVFLGYQTAIGNMALELGLYRGEFNSAWVGAILRLAVGSDTAGLLALLSGAIFIPSLALASGVWSGTSKLFEILYMLIWYLGPLNKLMALDYIGSHGNGRPEFFIPVSILLISFAFIGRTRQIRT